MQQFQGLYQGAFIIQTFGAHFSAIHGARKVPGVDGPGLAANPRGGLALSIAAVCLIYIFTKCFSPHDDQVEWALTLVATSTITIEMARSAKGKMFPLPKTPNYSTGKVSNRQTGFNDAAWGKSTRAYVEGINQELGVDMLKLIIHRATRACAKTNRTEDRTANRDTTKGKPDKRTQLKDRPCSESEEDSEDEEENE